MLSKTIPNDNRGEVALGTVTGAQTLDCSAARRFTVTGSGDITFALKNLPKNEYAWVEYAQDGNGAHAVAWNGAGGATVSAASAANLSPAAGASAKTWWLFIGTALDNSTISLVSKQT